MELQLGVKDKKELKVLNTLISIQEVLGDISGFEKEVRISGGKKRQEKAKIIGGVLMMNPRISLTEIANEKGIPISTIFDVLKSIGVEYDMRMIFIRRK